MHEFLARRMARKPYWLLVLLNSVLALLLIMGIGFIMRHVTVDGGGRRNPISFGWFTYPVVLSLFYLPTYVGATWRLHDTGHRSWPVWLMFALQICSSYLAVLTIWVLQAVGIHDAPSNIMAMFGVHYGLGFAAKGLLVWVIYLCCLAGDQGPNAYGPRPGSAPDKGASSSHAHPAPSV